jgi:hypothetical protein
VRAYECQCVIVYLAYEMYSGIDSKDIKDGKTSVEFKCCGEECAYCKATGPNNERIHTVEFEMHVTLDYKSL